MSSITLSIHRIKGVTVAARSLDEDCNYLVFHLEQDITDVDHDVTVFALNKAHLFETVTSLRDQLDTILDTEVTP